MNKKPVIFRSVFAVIVMAIFAISIYPLSPREFFPTLQGMIKKHDEKIDKVLKEAETLAQKDNLPPSLALEKAADKEAVDLTAYVKGKGLINNQDVISLVRRNAAGSIRLGLDLNGGVEFLLELIADEKVEKKKDEKGPEPLAENFERYRDIAIEILRNRMESQNIFELEISPAGQKYISLRVPLASQEEKQKLLNLIQMSAKLRFRLVHPENEKLVQEYQLDPQKFSAPVGYERMTTVQYEPNKPPQKLTYFVKVISEMDGKDIVFAGPYVNEYGRREIQLEFNTAGAMRFAEVTKANVGRQLAIVLDGKLYSAPSIRSEIPNGRAVITGSFSREESENISNALVSGSLPVRINVEAVFDTAPTLGRESVRNGFMAGIIAIIAVIVFMGIYYRRAGLVADVALVANMVLILGAMAAFEATLTLPGIAGMILTIGMSVDANVLIYERIREELAKGKTMLNAIEAGYDRAFSAILDSNLTTLFTALILMWMGTGPLKGFAVTLSIGILTSMFTALYLTRLVFDIMARFYQFKTMKMMSMFAKPNFDFLKMSKPAVMVSSLLILGTFIVIGVRGKDCLGVDFTGGTQVMLSYKERVPVDDVSKVMFANGYPDAKVTYKTSAASQDDKNLEILTAQENIAQEEAKTGKITSPMIDITNLLNKHFPQAGFAGKQETSLGGLIGWEFSKNAIIALILALIGIIVYVSLRFEFTYAIASVIALIHDVIIPTGIFLIMGRELSLAVIAALLTIIGYSINDTIVIFDRVRENFGLIKNKSYKEIINLSVNETLSRTILTSLTTFIVLLVLFVAGGISINDFTLVMLMGVVIGTYSTVFIASPIVSVWHKHIGSHAKDE